MHAVGNQSTAARGRGQLLTSQHLRLLQCSLSTVPPVPRLKLESAVAFAAAASPAADSAERCAASSSARSADTSLAWAARSAACAWGSAAADHVVSNCHTLPLTTMVT